MELDVTRSIEEQLEGPREEKPKLTVRQQQEKDRKNRAFTVKWRRMEYEETMKALYDEVARLAGRMERWMKEEYRLRGFEAEREYRGYANAPFDLIEEASRLKNNIPKMRWRVKHDIPNEIRKEQFGPEAKNDAKKIAKLEADIARIEKEKMPAAAFRIYEIWCEVAYTMTKNAHQNEYVKLSDYEVYDYDYEEDL